MNTENLHPVLRQMPADWQIVRIDDLFAIQQGKQVSARHRDGNHQRPFLRTKNVYWGRIDLTELDAMHFSEEEERRLRLLPGDLLTCEGGWVGRTAIWNGEAPDCLYQNHLHRLRRVSIDTDPSFALFWLWYAFEIGEIYFGRQNDTTIPNLSKSRLGELPMPSPSSAEQRKIAAVLSAVQRAVERQERLIALTAELKKALIHKLFTEGTRGERLKQAEIGLIPQSWNVDRLDRAGDVIYGIQAAVANNVKPVGTRILTNKNIDLDGNIIVDKQSYFELRTEGHRRTLLRKGDILFNWRSGSKEHVGKTAFFDLDGEWTHSSFILRIRPREDVSGRFLFHYLTWLRESKYFVKLHDYAVNAKFNKSAMSALPLVLPDRPEQEAIVASLDAAIKKFNVHRAQRTTLKRRFQNYLHQLMTAQVRVHDLDLSMLEEAAQEPTGAG
jgi:type I restriction enzyme, S subunit